MRINFRFLGTGATWNKISNTTNLVLHDIKYDIGFRSNFGRWEDYIFNGPGLFNLGKNSTEKTYKLAIEVISKVIDDFKVQYLPHVTFNINFTGHSRGAVTCSKVFNFIKRKYSSNEKITFSIKISDPYYGPSADGENISTKIDKSKSDNKNNLSTVVYAVKTMVNCTPQMVAKADIVIITNVGHNDSEVVNYDFLRPYKKGLYIAEKTNSGYFKYIKIAKTQESIQKFFDFVSKYGKFDIQRWRLFTVILIQKLKLTTMSDLKLLSNVNKSFFFPNVEKEFDKSLKSIKNAKNLDSAFDKALNLFSSGGMFGFRGIFEGVSGPEFQSHLVTAKACCKDKKYYKQAIVELNQIINKSGRSEDSIKSIIAKNLKEKIEKLL